MHELSAGHLNSSWHELILDLKITSFTKNKNSFELFLQIQLGRESNFHSVESGFQPRHRWSHQIKRCRFVDFGRKEPL